MNANSYQDENRRPQFMLDLTFLVDQLDLTLINCDHNMREVDKLVDCVKSQSSSWIYQTLRALKIPILMLTIFIFVLKYQ